MIGCKEQAVRNIQVEIEDLKTMKAEMEGQEVYFQEAKAVLRDQVNKGLPKLLALQFSLD